MVRIGTKIFSISARVTVRRVAFHLPGCAHGVTKKKDKKISKFAARPSVTDTELEMRVIPFFVDPVSPKREPKATPIIAEVSPDEIAEFDDDDHEDDTVTIECDFDDLADATKPIFEDDYED
jgi:hypothetical protein